MNNLLIDLPATLADVRVTVLAQNRCVRIERIVSSGQKSAPDFWYEQDEHEWVVVLNGEAALVFDDDEELLHLAPGDHLLIAAGRRHRVAWISADEATVWLVVFYRD